jgi:hypothetical protein
MRRLNWYRLANEYDPGLDPDFIGFHCQQSERGPYDDIIYPKEDYATDYFIQILNGLPFNLRDMARNSGLMSMPEKYSDEFDEWVEKVADFLTENGVRWIFVSDTRPLNDYGSYCYYVSMKNEDALMILDDINVNDTASAWVYMVSGEHVGKPRLVLMPDDDGDIEEQASQMYWGS